MALPLSPAVVAAEAAEPRLPPAAKQLLRETLQRARPAAPVATTGGCWVEGRVVDVPDYLKVKVGVMERAATIPGIGSIEIEPGTRRRDFRFGPIACESSPGTRHYTLHYTYRRHYGDLDAPRYSEHHSLTSGSYGVPVRVTASSPRHLDPERSLHTATTSGILLNRRETGKPEYRFGEVVRFNFGAEIHGAARPGVRRSEHADYVVTVRSGGLSHEVERGTLDVGLGVGESRTVLIHHHNYSLGESAIELQIEGSDYRYSGTTRLFSN